MTLLFTRPEKMKLQSSSLVYTATVLNIRIKTKAEKYNIVTVFTMGQVPYSRDQRIILQVQTDWLRPTSTLTSYTCVWKKETTRKKPSWGESLCLQTFSGITRRGNENSSAWHHSDIHNITKFAHLKYKRENIFFLFSNLNNGIICLYWKQK